MGQDVRSPRGPRCIALVGPFQSGKTTLLEAILARTGAIPQRRQRRCRNFRRRCQRRGPPSQDERRPHRRHDDLHGRQLHLHRLSRLGRVRARHARRASRGRCRGRGLRGRREEAAAAADHPARARRSGHPALSVPQQDRPRQQAHPRDARDLAAGLARAAGAAADSDLERRSDRRLRRSRAGARLRLSRAQGLRSDRARRRQSRSREGSALLDAGEARRPRRRADGAVARGHPAAARCGVRRSRPRIARRADLSGAARLGDARERRAAADEGAAPRSARRRRDRQAPRRARDQGRARLCVQDRASAARRQAVADAAARRPSRRRRDAAILLRRDRAGLRHPRRAAAPTTASAPSAEAGDTVALGKLDTVKTGDTVCERQDRAGRAGRRSSRRRRCWRSRSRPPTARTTSSSARRCCG